MNTAANLRKLADLSEIVPISDREQDVIDLVILHLLRRYDDHGHEAEEAKLLMRMPDEG
ncbi:MAG: hypothetical protein AAGB23_05135 [Pseudomonadota bacterium]